MSALSGARRAAEEKDLIAAFQFSASMAFLPAA